MKFFLLLSNTLLGLVLIFSVFSCYQKSDEKSLRPGDILFQDLDCGPLCDAIKAVTEGAEGRDFSHCGLVVPCGDSLCVLEAIGHSVRVTPLKTFITRTPPNKVLAGRFDKLPENVLDKAINYALAEVGKPYDDYFLPDNGAWYCSELIATAFNKASGMVVFEAMPMTFKASPKADFFPVWIQYFDSLKTPVPEGIPGFNPGAMSRHEDLILFKPKP
jgi:hypothetical protein